LSGPSGSHQLFDILSNFSPSSAENVSWELLCAEVDDRSDLLENNSARGSLAPINNNFILI
jgi:hypothetical protein